jgi:predicted alpha/beta-hydrolase family hydrolase
MSAEEWKVTVGADAVSAAYEPPSSGAESAVFACAHGAGGNMSDRGVLATANAMRANGIGVVRFNFLYKEKKSGRPDPMPKCMEVVSAIVGNVRAKLKPKCVIIGGRSMGGRAASMLAGDGFAADGLLLLAYPLHPAGNPEKVRDAHLPRITMPVLCFNGTRDTLCTPELMERALKPVTAKWDMRWIDSADHSFHVLKSSGRTDAQVMAEIGAVSGDWVRSLTPR